MSYINKVFNTPFFQNRFVLYGSLFLVLLNILRHLATGNVHAVVLMALIGLVVSYFSKNMIIVLLTAFSTVFVLEMVGSQGVMEGMDTKKGGSADKKESGTDENADDDNDNDKEKDKGKGGDKEKEKDKKKNDKNANKSDETDTDKKKEGNQTQNNLNSQKDPAKKKKQGMSSLSPASYDGKEHDTDGDGAHDTKEANRIDYASTLEQAYDNIENIIGEEGVRGLTDQTKSLMHQQKELMNNMKEMGPLLKSAEGFMHQVTGNGGIQGITNMLKGFATPASEKKK